MGDKVAILDAGAQYLKNIDKTVRALRVESDILPLNTSANKLDDYQALIISGGPQSVYTRKAPKYDPGIFSLGKPILGICYGLQLMTYAGGGKVRKKRTLEDGPCVIDLVGSSVLFGELPKTQEVLMSHGDSISRLARGFSVTAMSGGLVAAIENAEKKWYGVQFHPEVDLTVYGRQILHNFLYSISGLSGTYTLENRKEKAIKEIRDKVGDMPVLLLASGGVDSTVTAALLAEALKPGQIYAVHIDNGLMRLNESRIVGETLTKRGINVTVVDASRDFYDGRTDMNGITTPMLREVVDPRLKRRIIGNTFMTVAGKIIRGLGLDPEHVYLAQGTLRPDLIESGSEIASSNASVIKEHHNDTPLVRELRKKGRIIEPLRDYHKDEVRELGRQLGLPDYIIERQPFPGPGLAVRIICAEKPYRTWNRGITAWRLKQRMPRGINATLLPIQTVGVQGDERSYSYLAALSGRKNWDELIGIARKIPKRLHNINRVVYVFGEPITKRVKNITPTHLTQDAIIQLQHADDIVNATLREYDLLTTLSQVPVISFPLNFGEPGNRSIGIRPFITNDFMTGRPAIPGKDIPEVALDTMVERILKEVPGISRVCLDLTSKPPGTTEWE